MSADPASLGSRYLASLLGSRPRPHDTIARDLAGLGGILRCGECGTEDTLTAYGIASYLRDGWPRCCGYTMTWITQRQLDEEAK